MARMIFSIFSFSLYVGMMTMLSLVCIAFMFVFFGYHIPTSQKRCAKIANYDEIVSKNIKK